MMKQTITHAPVAHSGASHPQLERKNKEALLLSPTTAFNPIGAMMLLHCEVMITLCLPPSSLRSGGASSFASPRILPHFPCLCCGCAAQLRPFPPPEKRVGVSPVITRDKEKEGLLNQDHRHHHHYPAYRLPVCNGGGGASFNNHL